MIATGLMTLWAASTALGQLSFTVDGDDTLRLGAAACGTQTVTWTLATSTSLTALCSSMHVWLTKGQCGDEADTSADLVLSDVDSSSFSARTGTLDVDLDEAFTQLQSVTCGTTRGVEPTVRVCGSILTYATTTGCSSSNVLRGTALSITYDAKAPDAPTIDSVEGLDGSLRVTYSAPSADSVTSQARAQGDADFVPNATDSTVDGALKLTGLSNRTTYDVQLFAVDSVGNTSAASAIASGTPIPTLGFFAQYKAAGGSEQGCQGATGALSSALPAWLLWVRRRRRATL
jgi:hypothetical protein